MQFIICLIVVIVQKWSIQVTRHVESEQRHLSSPQTIFEHEPAPRSPDHYLVPVGYNRDLRGSQS